MERLKISVVISALLLCSCGGGSACDEEAADGKSNDSCVSSRMQDDGFQIGDVCDDEGVWVKKQDDDDAIALRCTHSVLGERSADRLKCLRSGYEILLSTDGLYAYCVNGDMSYSFLYDTDYGSYKPWHCSKASSSDKVKATDSNGNIWSLACDNQIYKPQSMTKEQTPSNPEGGMCKTSVEAEGDVLALFRLQDFDPELDQVEHFDPSAYCDAPADTNANPADNVSGSFLNKYDLFPHELN